MKDPDETADPWYRLTPWARGALWNAGLTDPEHIGELTDRELLALRGLGHYCLRSIRKVWPNPSPPKVPEKVIQAHGGAIYVGGVPGNKGGPGGRTSRVRALATERFETLIPRLVALAEDRLGKKCDACGRGRKPVKHSDQIRAISELGKHGPGTKHEVESSLTLAGAESFARELAMAVEKHVRDERTLRAILGEWRSTVRARFPGG